MGRKIQIIALTALLTFVIITALTAYQPAAEQKVQGVLMDKDCSIKAEPRGGPGNRLAGGIIEAYTHDKACLLMPACQRSGYGVYTYDNTFLMFDPIGKQKALAILKETKKESDFRVEVTGFIEDRTIKVTNLTLL